MNDTVCKFIVQQENKRVLWVTQYREEARNLYTQMRSFLAPIIKTRSDIARSIEFINENQLMFMSAQDELIKLRGHNIDLLVIDASMPFVYKDQILLYYPFTRTIVEK